MRPPTSLFDYWFTAIKEEKTTHPNSSRTIPQPLFIRKIKKRADLKSALFFEFISFAPLRMTGKGH